MWRRLGVETDFTLTNTTGIRADMVPGAVTVEQMFNIFPFDNSISKVQLSGVEVQELFDFVARRSAGRGCATQVQIAGMRVVLNCAGCSRQPNTTCTSEDDCPTGAKCFANKCVVTACAEQIYTGYRTCEGNAECGPSGQCVEGSCACTTDAQCGGLVNSCDIGISDDSGLGRCRLQIDPIGSYELATSTYLAGGGSGFVVLKKNTTQLDTKIQQRDALIDWVRGGTPCGFDANAGTAEGLRACTIDSDCTAVGTGYVCACPENASEAADGTCVSNGNCGSNGRCVLANCRQSVAEFFRATCAQAETAVAIASCTTKVTPCELGSQQCKFLPCIDRALGSFADGRVMMVGR
jgi:5'-nucleotidase